jgi:hypothetical protein
MSQCSCSHPISPLRVIDGAELPTDFADIGFFEVDRRVFPGEYEELTENELGSSSLSRAWYARNPSIYTVLLCGSEVVGYCNLMPLEDAAYEQILAGALADGAIAPDMVRPFDKPGPYKVFCCGVGIVEEYRRKGSGLRALLRGVWRRWAALAERGCYISELAGVAWSEEGRALCEGLRLHHIRKHALYGDVYRTRIVDGEGLPPGSLLRRLYELYRASGIL